MANLTGEQEGGQKNDEIVSFKLNNGMQVVLLQDHRLPVVTHILWYRVGSVDEEEGKSGLAHYLEHLAFKGTKRFPQGEYSRLIAVNGGESNAFTSFDYTAYYAQVPRDNLPLIMDMEADRMVNLHFDENSALTELEVVKEERKQRTEADPEDKYREKILAKLFNQSGYADPIIGWEDDLKNITPADAMAFYRQNYMPSNAVLTIAGNITAQEAKSLVEKYYGTIENTGKTPDRCQKDVAMSKAKQKYAHFLDPAVIRPSWSMLYNTTGISKKLHDIASMQILFHILGAGQNSRLYKKLVYEDKIAVSAGTYFSILRYSGLAGIELTPQQNISFDRIQKAVEKEIEVLKEQPAEKSEIERAKTQLEAKIIYKRDDQLHYALGAGRFVMNCYPVQDIDNYINYIRNVSAADIREAANKYLNEDYRLVSSLQNNDKLH